ncbi:hypothetical protein AcV5_008624 [Taiwanofungus camphoratus]|nr:hypothetical protein AcV5_008624 [Antrodia cinnamomea]
MSAKPPPPSPTHILRSHTAQVNALHFSDDNERVYSGDATGTVVVTSTRTLRSLAAWKAHTDGLLGVQEWGDSIITHGRDNKLHVWRLSQEPATKLGNSAASPGLQTPQLCYSMDVNALNYCRFSLLPRPKTAEGVRALALMILDFLNAKADIWTLPSKQRLHAAIGKTLQSAAPFGGRGVNSTGIIMSMHMSEAANSHISGRTQLRLLCAYENGSMTMWAYTRTDKETSVEGVGWESLWTVRLHVESVMGMAVSRDMKFALTVSADHLIGRYDIQAAERAQDVSSACVAHRTKNPGNSSIAIRDDGRVCAVAGWDGRIRLYSTKSLKPLGTLDYHKKSCQVVAFARSDPLQSEGHTPPADVEDDSEDEMSKEEKADRTRWLVAGGQDHRVSIWSLISFGGT